MLGDIEDAVVPDSGIGRGHAFDDEPAISAIAPWRFRASGHARPARTSK